MIATVVLISPRAVVIYMTGSDDGELAIVAAVADNGVIGDAVFPGWDESRWRRVSTEYRRLGHLRA